MNRICATALLLATVLGVQSTPAAASPRCEEIFKSLGRTYVADAPPLAEGPASGEDIMGCPADQAMQFVFDVKALREGVEVESAEKLIGTWVSDDVLMVVTGLFIPVYEVLEISRSETSGEVRIVQKVLRAFDPATWFNSDTNIIPPIDVVAAGRIATYGEHIAALREPGKLEPRKVRYHDFPLESERNTSLVMKSRLMSFSQTRPIEVASSGDRLVFQVADRLARKGNRVMTFRKRRPDLPESALLMALVGEISLSKFHCFLEAMETPNAAFTNSLGNHSEAEFHASLRTMMDLVGEREALFEQVQAEEDESKRGALENDIKALLTKQRQMMEAGPIQGLVQEASRDKPFGCPNYS